MKKTMLLVLLITSLIACNSVDDSVNPTNSKCSSFQIASIKAYNNDDQLFSNQTFTYNNEGLVSEILDPIRKKKIVNEYDNEGKLISKSTIDTGNNTDKEKDTYTYDADGRLTQVKKTNINFHYYYDDDGRLAEEKRSFPDTDGTRYLAARYHWGEKHLEKIEHFYDEQTLFFDEVLEYDDKCNSLGEFSLIMEGPALHDNNNLISREIIDHIGLYDGVCYECLYEYEFNSDGLPISMVASYGGKLEISYQ